MHEQIFFAESASRISEIRILVFRVFVSPYFAFQDFKIL